LHIVNGGGIYELFETVTAVNVTSPSAPDGSAADSRVGVEAERFRAVLAESRSGNFIQLFDYLLERSRASRAPKEIEIALAVFGKEGAFDTSQDSTVRVHVHRLRKRLDDFYASCAGPRLVIPSGEYRIVLVDGPGPGAAGVEAARSRRWPVDPWWIAAMLAVLGALVWGMWTLIPDRRADKPSPLVQTPFWRAFSTSGDPVLVATGDSYLFAETENRKDVKRLIMQPGIGSRQDLDGYLVDHPQEFYRFYDLDIHYMSAGTADALWSLLPLLQTLRPQGGVPVVMPASRLGDAAPHGSDIVYIGLLDDMGPLKTAMFHASGFEPGASAVELIDRASGKHYIGGAEPSADNSATARGEPYTYDYGYLARMPGPYGRPMLIVAGMTDIALLRMVDLASQREQLDRLGQRVGSTGAFEALYEVRTSGTLNVSTTLQVARALGSDGRDPDASPG